MLSEYQEKFPGHRTPAVQSTKQQNDHYQPLGQVTISKAVLSSDRGTQRVDRRDATKMDEHHPLKANTTSRSVYKEDFQAWNAEKVQTYKLRDNLTVGKGTFAKTTTSKEAYCHKGAVVNVRESFKPAPQTQEVLPFDGTTNYRSQYVVHPVQRRRPKERPAYQPNSAPLTRVFTSHQDYRGQPTEAMRPFKPRVAWGTNPAAFEGTTDFGEKFKTWPVFQHKAEKYRVLEGDVAFISTTHADYGEHCCEQRQSRRNWPPKPGWRDGKPLEATSTMKEDYKDWATAQRSPVVRKQEPEKPAGAVKKTTAAQSSYTPKAARRPVSQEPLIPRLEEASVYRSSFTAKEIPRCPVRDGAPTPGLEEQSVGARGHRLYRTYSRYGCDSDRARHR